MSANSANNKFKLDKVKIYSGNKKLIVDVSELHVLYTLEYPPKIHLKVIGTILYPYFASELPIDIRYESIIYKDCKIYRYKGESENGIFIEEADMIALTISSTIKVKPLIRTFIFR